MISTSGSGQMVPIPMNEFMQQNFKAVGMDIDFDVVEWGTMLVAVRNAPTAPQSHGDDGINISLSFTDPSSMFRYYATDSFSPINYNWGHWSNAEATDLLRKAQATFDPAEQLDAVAEGARHRRRRGAVAVHRARPQPARAVAEGDQLPSRAKLVRRTSPRSRWPEEHSMLSRRDFLIATAGAAAAPALPAAAASPQVLRIAMTAADLPSTHGIPNNGFEGYRFLGYQPYDALVNWDLGQNAHDKPADIRPGLFTEWQPDETNPLRWIFTVRQGVKFHDGTDFNADAVIWNLRPDL